MNTDSLVFLFFLTVTTFIFKKGVENIYNHELLKGMSGIIASILISLIVIFAWTKDSFSGYPAGNEQFVEDKIYRIKTSTMHNGKIISMIVDQDGNLRTYCLDDIAVLDDETYIAKRENGKIQLKLHDPSSLRTTEHSQQKAVKPES